MEWSGGFGGWVRKGQVVGLSGWEKEFFYLLHASETEQEGH